MVVALKVGEFKPKGSYKSATVKKGRALFGMIDKHPTITVYWAIRRPEEIFLALNAWAIDIETLNMLKTRAVTHVGIKVTNGDRYLTTIEAFKEAVVLNYSEHVGAQGKKGALQRYLPLQYFAFKKGDADDAIKAMRIKGRR